MAAAALLVVLLLQARDAPAPAGATLSGRVTDEATRRPLPRIVVTLFDKDHSPIAETVTNDEGRFRFRGVAAGKYALLAAQDEHRSTYLRQWFGENEPAERFGAPPRLPIAIA